jgi:DNA-binding MarR family transcriptional regulator
MGNALFPTRSGIMARLGIAFLTWRRYLQRGLTPFGITLKQQFVLRQLSKTEHLYPSDIAEMLFCDRPTATVILDNLEKQGWIRREREHENRKFMRIILTATGKEKVAELQTMQAPDFDPLAPFSEEELKEFDRLLRKLNQHLKQLAGAGDDSEV